MRCRVLSVYLVWSLVVQLGCTLWVVYREGGDLKQLGMHMLVLTANNTGIIGAWQALHTLALPCCCTSCNLQQRPRVHGMGTYSTCHAARMIRCLL